jgi:hypothetical protein
VAARHIAQFFARKMAWLARPAALAAAKFMDHGPGSHTGAACFAVGLPICAVLGAGISAKRSLVRAAQSLWPGLTVE